MIRIIGLRLQKYIGIYAVSGHNGEFEYEASEMEKHILLGLDEEFNDKIEITLYREEGVCGSGWTAASWGCIEVERVDTFGTYTHRPISSLTIPDITTDTIDVNNGVIKVSYNGGDPYYPRGYYTVDMDLFVEEERGRSIRPTYIFFGDSGLGKSSLAAKLTEDIKVYETDIDEKLPDAIIADVVVVGNKYNHTPAMVIDRLSNTNPILCNFKL